LSRSTTCRCRSKFWDWCARKYPNAGLAIIGAGSLEADLAARIAAKPYAQHVLLCGDVPHAGTLRAIEDCSVFLRTTLYDGDSISVREALHVGATVIASENGMRPPGVRLISPENLDAATSRDFRSARCAAGAKTRAAGR